MRPDSESQWFEYKSLHTEKKKFRICIEVSCTEKEADDLQECIEDHKSEHVQSLVNSFPSDICDQTPEVYIQRKGEKQ